MVTSPDDLRDIVDIRIVTSPDDLKDIVDITALLSVQRLVVKEIFSLNSQLLVSD